MSTWSISLPRRKGCFIARLLGIAFDLFVFIFERAATLFLHYSYPYFLLVISRFSARLRNRLPSKLLGHSLFTRIPNVYASSTSPTAASRLMDLYFSSCSTTRFLLLNIESTFLRATSPFAVLSLVQLCQLVARQWLVKRTPPGKSSTREK